LRARGSQLAGHDEARRRSAAGANESRSRGSGLLGSKSVDLEAGSTLRPHVPGQQGVRSSVEALVRRWGTTTFRRRRLCEVAGKATGLRAPSPRSRWPRHEYKCHHRGCAAAVVVIPAPRHLVGQGLPQIQQTQTPLRSFGGRTWAMEAGSSPACPVSWSTVLESRALVDGERQKAPRASKVYKVSQHGWSPHVSPCELRLSAVDELASV
jgi:hypothetical protein